MHQKSFNNTHEFILLSANNDYIRSHYGHISISKSKQDNDSSVKAIIKIHLYNFDPCNILNL